MFDQEGYLLDSSKWNLKIAQKIAIKENLNLTAKHWQIIDLVRRFYELNKFSPTTRILVKYLSDELGVNQFNSGTLNLLFNGKPAKIAAKIAGIPKPSNCI